MSLTFADSHCSRHCENAMNSNKKYKIPKKTFRPSEGAGPRVLVSLQFIRCDLSTFTKEMVLVPSITRTKP
jgi:hypothetical protein